MKTANLIDTIARGRALWLVVALLAALPLGLSVLPRAVAAVHPDPIIAAWQRAQAAGSYHFTSDVVQETIPSATISNVGRSSRTEQLRLEGQADLRRSALELRLWNNGGSVLQDASGLGVRVEDGKTWVRQGAGEWTQAEGLTDSMAPQGDFMAYLAAVRDVTAHAPETRAGIAFTRYSFRIDGPTWASHMRDQLEAAMRQKGELPSGTQLDVPSYYRDMRGTGELWVRSDGLPLRQVLDLAFPEQHDEHVDAHITVDFSQFDQVGGATGFLDALQQYMPAPTSLLGFFLALALVSALVRFHRSRRLYNAVVVVVIASLVVGPLLSDLKISSFMDTQAAKAAAQDAQRAESDALRELRTALAHPEFDPHAKPLAASLQSPVSSLQSAPTALTSDTGVDTDGDTLSDFVEERIGTSTVISDTDNDGLGDNIEVNGFSFGGQRWYTNPEAADSNGDGQGDALEWGISADGTPRATPLDSDGDGIPDLFDTDNDGDGVPDNKDIAPFAKGAASYTEAAPLQLKLNNLTAGKPTFVEFQVRPQNEKQLWYAFNVLDWPQDSQGQVRDIDGKTYADAAATQGRTPDANEANGDMKLVPMLEIRMPANGANLPPQADLTPFNITVNNYTADGQTKVAYVPLSIVTDENTGERVAFSGQMRYLPSGSWPSPHQVRLAWVVQTLVDVPCDKTIDTSADCQADGYRNNVPQIIQSYYSDWSLAGLTVREEHGTDTALFYEDPAVDTDKKDDQAIWALAYALEGQFVT
ncbi:MAG: thrombospondin type 3 repeat-containing protein, partial [Chloroflexota bacterium]|nr:thrombospondin type 3 repeat-containing protein [Chloroflexota bacterium]